MSFHSPPAAGGKPDRASRVIARPAGAAGGKAAEQPREAKQMGTVTITIPLVTWRDGRPRYFPSPAQRAMGYKGEDLRHGKAGKWFTVEEAVAWSTARQADITTRRSAIATGETTQKAAARDLAQRRAAGLATVADVVQAYLDSPRMQGKAIEQGRKKRRPLAATTIAGYKGSAGLLRKFDGGAVWTAPAVELTGKALAGVLDMVEQRHGLAQTRAVRGFLSVAFGHSKGTLVAHNPVADLEQRLPVLEADVRPATVAEFLHLVAVADALGMFDVADIICCGVWTGQRPGDRRALTERQMRPDGILFEPNKKAASRQRLLVPISAHYAARLASAKARRKDWAVQPLNVHVSEHTRRPWAKEWLAKNYRVMRHAAATGDIERNPATKGQKGRPEPSKDAALIFKGIDIPGRLAAAGITPMASVSEIHFKHFRDTCLEWLRDAGADDFERGAFAGHAYAFSGREIQRHYLTVPPHLAVSGMAKLEAWYAAQVEAMGKAAAT